MGRRKLSTGGHRQLARRLAVFRSRSAIPLFSVTKCTRLWLSIYTHSLLLLLDITLFNTHAVLQTEARFVIDFLALLASLKKGRG